MDQVREVPRYFHYANRTETNDFHWIVRCLHFYGGKTHPNQPDSTHIERFLSHLVTEGRAAAEPNVKP